MKHLFGSVESLSGEVGEGGVTRGISLEHIENMTYRTVTRPALSLSQE
jgi:hypothetical protein